MFKSKVTLSAILIVIILLFGGGILAVRHNNQQAEQKRTASAEQAKKLADWQAKVKAWNIEQARNKQQELAATSASNSSLETSGVTQLPRTGTSDSFIMPITAGFIGIVVYQIYTRRALRQ